MAEEALKALQEKLKALEQKLQGQSDAGTSASASAATPSQVTVKVPRERKLRKFAGSRDDHAIEDWIQDAERATAGHADAEAVDLVLYHLEGAAREEVRLRPPEQRADKTAIFGILRSAFGEGLNSTQALRRFFERRQKERESIQEYSHALMLLLARVERLNPDSVPDKEKLLRDQFLENLRDPQLRRDIKRWARDHPAKTFQQVREEVQRWVDEDVNPQRRVAVREAAAEHPPGDDISCDEVKGVPNLRKVIDELVAGQKLLAENLQKQQKLLSEQIQRQQAALDRQQQAISQLSTSTYTQQWQPGCFGCGSRSHMKRDCPSNRQNYQRGGSNRGRGDQSELPALNEKTPRQ